MFKKRFNQIRIDLSIEPHGPLLIRSGRQGTHPERPDLEAVRTRVDGEPSVYIPGSSLKGVMRSYSETLLRTQKLDIEDPFVRDSTQDLERNDDPGTEDFYSNSCPIGRTYGNLQIKGHVSVTDLIPGGREPSGSPERRHQVELANRLEQRNGVGIDRLLGSTSGGALYDAEAVVQGRFDGRILLVNVQLYQLALVLWVLRELNAGFVALGSASSRGFGRVSVAVDRIHIETKSKGETSELRGVGSLMSGGDSYGFFSGDSMPLPSYLSSEDRRLLWQRWTVPGSRWTDFSQDLLGEPWNRFIEQARRETWKA